MRSKILPFHVPAIGQDEARAVEKVLRSGWLTSGPIVKEFETSFAEYVGARYAVALSSGTAALHLGLEALGVGTGDEVVVPTMTFAATAEVVIHLGARPVLVDCSPDTLNMDPASLERVITEKTKAVIPVHFGGQPCEMDALLSLARKYNLVLIEDAAHALPAGYHGKTIGALSPVTCFSFYVTKTLCTGEGGMVTTNDEALAKRIRKMSLHGISQDAWKRYSNEGSWRYEIESPGYKYNFTDVAAAMGLEQLKKCDTHQKARQDVALRYTEAFGSMPEISPPSVLADLRHAWHLYVIQLNLEKLKIGRDTFIEELRKQKIGTSVHFIPLHLHPYYRNTYGYKAGDFPNASEAYNRIISLPIYPGMTERDIMDVIQALANVVRQNGR